MAYTDNISRLSRLTAVLLKLQSKKYVSIHELADEFQVSRRTIYRDLASLEQAGVPLLSEEGKGYALIDGYVIPPVMFTEAEANALMVAEKIVAKTKDASLIFEFTKAIDKIRAVLDSEEKEKSEFLSERTIIGKNWENEKTSSFLSEIQQSLTNYQVLDIEHQKANESSSTRRKVEPFAIYHNTSENWILIAWCRLREDFRTFRVDRIKRLHTLSETFTPHKISLEEYVEMQKQKFAKDP